MADNISKEERSRVMAQIKGKDTKPETMVRKYLFSRGLRYRKNDRRYQGAPDIVLAKHKAAVFVNGCFWHAHEGCKHFRMPKSRQEYWVAKLEKNRARDALNAEALRSGGWKVIYVWECELEKSVAQERLERLYREITGVDGQEEGASDKAASLDEAGSAGSAEDGGALGGAALEASASGQAEADDSGGSVSTELDSGV
jgi:DNA mismatch endonuclease (patch repair protein)